jgi:hypothetical protein
MGGIDEAANHPEASPRLLRKEPRSAAILVFTGNSHNESEAADAGRPLGRQPFASIIEIAEKL